MGGGTMRIDLPMIQFSTPSNPPPLLPLASSNLNFLNSANQTPAPLIESCAAWCSSHTSRKLESVEGTGDKREGGSLDYTAFYSVPSKFEVENAVAALQQYSRTLLTQGCGIVRDTFRLLVTDPSVKRLVVSLSSDEVVWDAVLNNELVRKLLHSPFLAKTRPMLSDEEPNLWSDILRWILEIAKAKVMELIEKFQLLMNEVIFS
ncbi:hypothetical protein Patl1_00158 [Pistacia atlantica]|uniref:Uncharacterized protein n=1 Tax=Pistacia atlantica TaxID=434234 RepID=A0ACC1CBD7_9ROSI|nr:hypothetical protein Patl1_00158 [Pistacia atlantica]